jgi:NAD(P)-dependent dehydrogenase (short-subunit alcohol dehydrogenase family)
VENALGYAGKNVVVTGAASGMGGAAAKILIDLGANVTALDIKDISAPVAKKIHVDLSKRESIDAAVAQIDGDVDAVFSCAGLPGPPFSDVDVTLVNFAAGRHLIESLLPRMEAGAAAGCISSSGSMGWEAKIADHMELATTATFEDAKAWLEAHPDAFGISSYIFSKQVLNTWVSWRSAQLIKDGIRLNCINPGPTASGMMPAFEAMAGKEAIEMAVGPIGRYSTSEEQAWPLVLLNSPRMSYVVGESFFTDGGFAGALLTGQIKMFEVHDVA